MQLIHTRVLHLLLDDYPAEVSRETSTDKELLALVDQFVDYVPDVDEVLVAPVRTAFGEENLRDVLEAIYVLDQLTRLYVTHTKVFGSAGSDALSRPTGQLPELNLQKAAAAWHDKVLELTYLDSRTAEITRLRGAFYHTCRLCMTVRVVEHDEVVADERLVDAVRENRGQPLSERERIALRYADAHMVDPQQLDQELVTDLKATFTDDELIELTLDLTAWNHQKVAVALKTDGPVTPGQLTALHIRDDGRVEFGRTLGPA